MRFARILNSRKTQREQTLLLPQYYTDRKPCKNITRPGKPLNPDQGTQTSIQKHPQLPKRNPPTSATASKITLYRAERLI